MNKEVKCVIVGDIINSKKIQNTSRWEYFEEVLNKLNRKHSKRFEISLTIYSGDSFGAVMNSFQDSAVLANELLHFFRKELRLIIIEDEIIFGLQKGNFLQLEGPALWKAEELMNNLKKTDNIIDIRLKDKKRSICLKTIYNLILDQKNKWNDFRYEIFNLKKAGILQKEIAERYAVSPQYISKELKYISYDLINEAEENLMLLWD